MERSTLNIKQKDHEPLTKIKDKLKKIVDAIRQEDKNGNGQVT